MTEIAWKLVPVNPTSEMISAGCGLESEGNGYNAIAAKCVRDWNAMLKAAPVSPAHAGLISGRPVTTETLARHLYEIDDPDIGELSWPENDEDDGNRGDGGWVKLVPPLVADEYRERARGIMAFMGIAD